MAVLLKQEGKSITHFLKDLVVVKDILILFLLFKLKSMIKWLLFIYLMGWSCLGFSQIVSVQDKESKNALGFVSITDKKTHQTLVTNAAGKADVSDFKEADEIVFSFIGYASKTLSFEQLKTIDFKVQLEPSSINLNQVVVSANRWRQESANVPSKITSISPKEVALQNPQTAADLLNVSGKVFIQKSQQGGGSPMIRGFATNRLLYTVDGVRMNTAIFRGGNIQNVISLDPFATENTEVFFGPGSVIYGSDAIGGVMSFQTLTPQFSLTDTPQVSGKAVGRYSSANREKTGHFDVNVGWKKWALVSSFSSYDYDHLKMGSDGPDDYLMPYYVKREDSTDVVVKNEDPELQRPSAYSQINLMQKVRFKPNNKWDFEYGFHYSETSPYGRYDRHNRMRDGLPRYAEWSYGPQKWMMNNLSILHHGKNKLYDELSIRIAQQSFEESRISRDFNKSNREIREEHVEAYSANFDFSKNIGSRHNLFYGVEAVYNDVKSVGTDENIESGIKMPGASRYPQANWASYGIYLNDQFALSEKVMLQAGLRYNQYQINADFDTTFYPFPFTEAKIDNGALSGNLGVVYRPADDWVIRANLATAFRSPNVDDIGKVFDSEPGAVVVPNPNLQAEYAYSADVGIAKVFGDFLKVDLSAYYTQLQDAMVRRDYRLNGMDSINYDGEMSRVQALQNAAVAHVYGVQFGFEWKLPLGFSLSTDLNFQEGEEEMEDGSTSPSRHVAPFFGVSRLAFQAEKLRFQLYSQYQGERSFNNMPVSEVGKTEIYALDDQGRAYAPAWYTLNFKASYQLSKVLMVTAGLENITDQRYRPYSSGISGAGRNFILSLRADF